MDTMTPARGETGGLPIDGSPIDDYVTAPTQSGQFASVVERNLVFEVSGTVYQVRIQRSAQHDYGLLNRWSAGKEDWSIVAKRRPSEYGIAGHFPARYDPAAFDDLIDDFIEMAHGFEAAFERSRRDQP